MIIELKIQQNPEDDSRLAKVYNKFEKILSEIKKRDWAESDQYFINSKISCLNSFQGTTSDIKKEIRIIQTEILRHLEKKHKIVCKGHFTNLWMALGLAIFGVPMGVIYGTTMDNMGLLGIGLPIGMVIGMAIGAGMDKKAAQEGRQLDAAP